MGSLRNKENKNNLFCNIISILKNIIKFLFGFEAKLFFKIKFYLFKNF